MPYQRKAQGYIDNQALARARQANTEARGLMRRILQEKPPRGLLYQLLAELSHALGDELDALTEMDRIRLAHRRRIQKQQHPGPSPDAAPDTR